MKTTTPGVGLPLDPAPANDRLKRSFSAWLWSSMIAATLAHFGMFALWPELTAEVISVSPTELEAIELPDEIDIPEAPPELTRPADPIASADVDPDLTIAPTTIEANPPSKLPPPPAARGSDLSTPSRITPYTVKPSIRNMDQIVRAMEHAYPPQLRDAGIGGTVHVLFHIDEDGRVQDFRLDRSSGHEALDRAALSVASVYRFSPALNRDKRVAVWVSFPVRFEVR